MLRERSLILVWPSFKIHSLLTASLRHQFACHSVHHFGGPCSWPRQTQGGRIGFRRPDHQARRAPARDKSDSRWIVGFACGGSLGMVMTVSTAVEAWLAKRHLVTGTVTGA